MTEWVNVTGDTLLFGLVYILRNIRKKGKKSEIVYKNINFNGGYVCVSCPYRKRGENEDIYM